MKPSKILVTSFHSSITGGISLGGHFHKEINIFYLLVKVTMHIQGVGK